MPPSVSTRLDHTEVTATTEGVKDGPSGGKTRDQPARGSSTIAYRTLARAPRRSRIKIRAMGIRGRRALAGSRGRRSWAPWPGYLAKKSPPWQRQGRICSLGHYSLPCLTSCGSEGAPAEGACCAAPSQTGTLHHTLMSLQTDTRAFKLTRPRLSYVASR